MIVSRQKIEPNRDVVPVQIEKDALMYHNVLLYIQASTVTCSSGCIEVYFVLLIFYAVFNRTSAIAHSLGKETSTRLEKCAFPKGTLP